MSSVSVTPTLPQDAHGALSIGLVGAGTGFMSGLHVVRESQLYGVIAGQRNPRPTLDVPQLVTEGTPGIHKRPPDARHDPDKEEQGNVPVNDSLLCRSLPERVIRSRRLLCHDGHMLMNLSNQLADAVAAVAASVVQVRARSRAASGLVYGEDLVLTTGRVIGRDEHPEIRTPDGRLIAAEVAGWDPASRLVLLAVKGLKAPAIAPGAEPRVGHLALAIGRSWSNAVTVTAGLVSIIGGPLRTAPRREIQQVIRTSAPMHDGFAGGAFIGADGGLSGIATAASIRGLGVVIPARIAWQSAASLVERGSLKRGYLGIVAQPVGVPEKQRPAGGGSEALLVVGVKEGSPAAGAGLLVGDLLLSLDGVGLSSPEDLLDLLVGDRVGRPLTLRVLRGGSAVDVSVTAAERK